MSPSPELPDALSGPPAIPRAIAGLIIAAIAAASLAALAWPSLPFNLTIAPVPGPSAVGVITKDIEVAGSAGRVGAPAPDFEWVDPAGRTRTLATLRGNPVVLNFWATWCLPCREEMPALERAAAAHPEVVFLEIDLQEDGDTVRRFFEALGLKTLQPLLDTNGSVFRRYAVISLPSTFFVDRDGAIRHLEIGGPMTDETIRRGLDKASGR